MHDGVYGVGRCGLLLAGVESKNDTVNGVNARTMVIVTGNAYYSIHLRNAIVFLSYTMHIIFVTVVSLTISYKIIIVQFCYSSLCSIQTKTTLINFGRSNDFL